jgi:uncharacterized protein (DUF4415 family)
MMEKRENIVRYSAEELAAMRARGESRTDWAKIDAMSKEEIEEARASDPDSAIPPQNWDDVMIGIPNVFEPKHPVNIRLDADVWRWFREQGKGYQTRINAVLRSYMLAQKSKEHHPR